MPRLLAAGWVLEQAAGESEEAAALEVRGQDFKPVEIVLFGHLGDVAGDRDALDLFPVALPAPGIFYPDSAALEPLPFLPVKTAIFWGLFILLPHVGGCLEKPLAEAEDLLSMRNGVS